jgi:hypothetical protein
MGTALWQRSHRQAGYRTVDNDLLLSVCEQMDERVALRTEVLANPQDWPARSALRTVDAQISQGLRALGLARVVPVPQTWPPATCRWWAAVRRMPHCVLWTETDWQFALDTALLAATLHNGDPRIAGELRRREYAMGTTGDARRDLRIRYVDAMPDDADPAIVTVMDSYRNVASGS